MKNEPRNKIQKQYKIIGILLVVLLLNYHKNYGQSELKIIKANSNKTFFIEDNNGVKNNWWLDPTVKLDIYHTSKNKSSKDVRFYTDIDSLSIKLCPGETYNFIVLLNAKDSCFTQIISDAVITKFKDLEPSTHDTISFTLSEDNNIVIKALLNGKDSLQLFFDTGARDLLLTKTTIKNKTSLLNKENSSTNQIFKKNSLKIGNLEWSNISVYPIELNPYDGHFGWNFFDGRLVEINYDKNILIIHSSLPSIPKDFVKLPIEYIKGYFFVNGFFQLNRKQYSSRFLFDSGYQRAIILDNTLVKAKDTDSLEVLKITILKNSHGKEFETKIFNLNEFSFKSSSSRNIPAQYLTASNPTGFPTHILGCEFLKRFNTILDFQNNYVYLKQNSLVNHPYLDGK